MGLSPCGPDETCITVFLWGPDDQEYVGNAFLDSGASISLIPDPIAEELDLPIIGQRTVLTANGLNPAMPVVAFKVQLGDNVTDPAYAIGFMTPADPRGNDRVGIGNDLIKRYGLLVAPRLLA
jgi:hypothetical protein